VIFHLTRKSGIGITRYSSSTDECHELLFWVVIAHFLQCDRAPHCWKSLQNILSCIRLSLSCGNAPTLGVSVHCNHSDCTYHYIPQHSNGLSIERKILEFYHLIPIPISKPIQPSMCPGSISVSALDMLMIMPSSLCISWQCALPIWMCSPKQRLKCPKSSLN